MPMNYEHHLNEYVKKFNEICMGFRNLQENNMKSHTFQHI